MITWHDEATITIDDIRVANFVYLVLSNPNIRRVIDTLGKRAILIFLGRFTAERKQILDGLRTSLRERGFVPLVFDFDRPVGRDLTETIATLAGMSLFVIADITNPRSAPLELQATVPQYMIPIVPIIQEGEQPFPMFHDLKSKFDCRLPELRYDTLKNLVDGLDAANHSARSGQERGVSREEGTARYRAKYPGLLIRCVLRQPTPPNNGVHEKGRIRRKASCIERP